LIDVMIDVIDPSLDRFAFQDGTSVGPVLPEVTTLQWHYYPAKNKTTTTQHVEAEGETVAAVVVASGFDIHVLWLKKTSKHHKPQVRLHYETAP
jgi:hypothetical protein